jgi:flagellar hook protein FlgE
MNISGIASGGTEEAQKTLERTAERIARSDSPPEDMVELLSARDQFETNARVIQTADEMQKRLIDIFA